MPLFLAEFVVGFCFLLLLALLGDSVRSRVLAFVS